MKYVLSLYSIDMQNGDLAGKISTKVPCGDLAGKISTKVPCVFE